MKAHLCPVALLFLLLSSSSLLLGQTAAAGGLRISVKVAPQPVHAGEQPIISAIVSGGSPPYKHDWYDGARKSSVVTPNVNWAGAGSSTHTYRVVVTDSAGQTAEAQAIVAIEPAGQESAAPSSAGPLTAVITPEEAEVDPGGSTQTVPHVTGGVPPYTYQWFNGDKVSGGEVVWSNLNRLGRHGVHQP